ncbi:metal-dependent hydrolase [Streptomyces sp. CA-249302]|uniref:metal-dependent hydrolase n=1 Tax=Streptomyces sp. CA-249302 TaxID=3240058 RepID=UPI003D940E16
MQIPAYYTDTYEEQAHTHIAAIGKSDGTPWVAVKHCLFHPQGGGQPADRGWIDGHEITPVRDHNSTLIVATATGQTPLPLFSVGQPVKTRIHLPTRTAHAALHTTGHLIEAAGRAQGWTLTANNHFPGQARIEFTPPTDARLDSPESREEATEALRTDIAKAIAQDLPVTCNNDAKDRRIVHLADLHSAPCGGTHVRSLGDLTDVVLPTLKMKKGRIRVSYSATHRSPVRPSDTAHQERS